MTTVLVTGASSGIGHAVALALAEAGHEVIAAARRHGPLEAMATEGRSIIPLTLDVTSDASVAAAMAELDGRRIDVLVNNAGYAEVGPIEDVPPDRITAQFETNVTGAVRMIQAVLPAMRAGRSGRIVNVSSVAGRVALPFMGVYSASKFALEGLSDALRIELAAFGIGVVLVEPAAISSGFNGVAADRIASREPRTTAWQRYFDPVALLAAYDARGAPVEVAAEAIVRACIDERPGERIVAPANARRLITMRRWLPTSKMDTMLWRRVAGRPG